MQPNERSVIHLNIADFSVAVERVIDPCLKEKPLIIAPLGSARAMVHDMSEEAFSCGVRKGMKLTQATRLCRGATLLAPRFTLYQKAMTAFIKQVYSYTPLIEHGQSDGHLFLDISGTHRLFGPPPDVGWRLQKEIRKQLRLHPIWTLATNKLVAKVASRLVKPIGEYIVPAGEEQEFLAPLPLSLLPGIKPQEKAKMYEFNMNKIHQLATMTQHQLMVPFGRRAEIIQEISRGIDQSPVTPGTKNNRGISFEHTFPEDTNDRRQIEGTICLLTMKICKILRQKKLVARRIGITLTYTDSGRCIRQATRKQPSNSDAILTGLSLLALSRAWTRRTRLSSCQLSCDLFQRQSPQLTLFQTNSNNEQRQEKLIAALDNIRDKYGEISILTGQQYYQSTTGNRCQ